MKKIKNGILALVLVGSLMFVNFARAYNADFRISEMSIFTMAFPDIFPVNAEEALSLYLGGWIGTQGIMVNGKQVMEAAVQQFCVVQKNSAEPRILMTGTITSQTGEEVPIQATMYVRNNELFSDIRTVNGKIAEYRGILEENSVVWVPKYLAMSFDWQRDSFAYQKKGLVMYSQALKFVEMKSDNFSGIIGVDMRLTRDDANFPVRDVRPFKSAFGVPRSKPSMGE